MPESAPPDPDRSALDADGPTADPAAAFERLESAVEELLDRHVELRDRVKGLESEQASLKHALSGSGDGDPEALGERLEELASENRRLRDVLEEGRERAERIRSRLRLMEDEA